MCNKPAVVILSQWFAPAYEAGGPVVSLLNLVQNISKDVPVFVIAGNKQPSGRLINEEENSLKDFELRNVHIVRGSGFIFILRSILKLWNKPYHFTWYYNDIFMLTWFIFPRFLQTFSRRSGENQILATRGMLLTGALSQKALKKKLYLWFYSLYQYWFPVRYHFTSENERLAAQVRIGAPFYFEFPNLGPKVGLLPQKEKEANRLRIGIVGRIHPIKNLSWIFDVIMNLPEELQGKLCIYFFGNVEDVLYYRSLRERVDEFHNLDVKFHGGFTPIELEKIYQKFDVLCCPSLSENYGQSIAQALAWGIPVIASENTPWEGLEEANAGFTIDPSNTQGYEDRIIRYLEIGGEDWERLRYNVIKFAQSKFNFNEQIQAYRDMFGISENNNQGNL
ncbi:glycosyltransferase [Luteibaculum oceani]|uniref:Glycosyltransferase n=1 Tax=Luteibaculum oceani TaxID=1294296 RepID=A0A5C6VAN1_9FLAO|nr:glycosyltransferase [Luteibaculum oceani]TXC81396.1 glycosyltransferase [Luteibaculum oceani]